MSSWDEGPQPAGEADFALRRFSTDDIPERDRLPVWHEEFGRCLVRVQIEPASDERLRAEAALRAFPDLRMLSFKGTPMHFNRTRSMAAAGDDSIGLIVNRGATSSVSQGGRELLLGDGEACMVLTNEAGALTGRQHFGMLFPRAVLASRIKNIESVAMRRIPADSAALRLMMSYLSSLPDDLSPEPSLQHAVVNHIHDLAALAIRPPDRVDSTSSSAVAAARLQRALVYILRRFDDPGLTITTAAAALGISPRYLQRLFETTGTSFTAHVTELRLQRAFSLLNTGGKSRGRIADIALEAGFSDVSYFNRLFRYRFGDTPSGVRAREKA